MFTGYENTQIIYIKSSKIKLRIVIFLTYENNSRHQTIVG